MSTTTGSQTDSRGSASGLGVAVITGASAGIGAIYADRLAARGYDLILVARRADRLEALAARLRSETGRTVEVLVADLATSADLGRVATAIAGDPRITMLVNNAGIAALTPLASSTAASEQAMIDLNVTALTRLSVAILPAFVGRDRGTIVNISSVLAVHTLPFSAVYSGTKAYVSAFTRGLQAEVAGTPVVVQQVLPAATRTDFWEIGGVPLSALNPATVMSAEDLVDAALADLDAGVLASLPSVEDDALWSNHETAASTLFVGAQRDQAACRYAGHAVHAGRESA
jgi:short-subunit dehydrogenase